MLNLHDINSEITRLGDLKILVETYKLIASSTMQKIRNSVLQNRAFHAGLNKIFQEVTRAHQKELLRIMRLRRGKNKTNLPVAAAQDSKRLFIFLSANTGLYGDIISKTFSFFTQEFNKAPADIVVVGRIGKSLMEEFLPEKKFTYFDFPDDRIDVGALAAITNFTAHYEKVFAFYGRFRSFLTQEPVTSSITGEEEISGGGAKEEARYLFEPSLEIVVAFFEKEIFASLLEQAFNESRLAKLASRMMLLERSTQNIETNERRATMLRQHIRHEFSNKKQLNAIGGLSLWDNL